MRSSINMKKTYQQLINFLNFARPYVRQNAEQTKFRYALERMDKRLKKILDDYADALNDLQISNAAEDDRGVLLTDDKGNFRYTKQGLLDRNKAQRDLLQKEIEVDPYYATELPPELSDAEKEICAGFVMPETVQEEQAA